MNVQEKEAITIDTVHTPPVLNNAVILTMAVGTGVAVANIYYNQPMLEVMSRDMQGNRAVAQVAMVTQLGYALGLALLVPLGDFINRRKLIVWQFVGCALAAAWTAASGNAFNLMIASLLLGLLATAAQHIVPYAVHLADPMRKGQVLGTVMSGLFCGILLSRTLAGFVATHAGWRAMFWLCVPISAVCALCMSKLLPDEKPQAALDYRKLLVSLKDLWLELPALRRAAYTQALTFSAFSAFWTTLAFRLAEPPFGMSATVAGLFGVLGILGVLIAPITGRLTDRMPARTILLYTISMIIAAWLLFGFWNTMPGLVIGVTLLDFGNQSSLITNQSVIYKLRPEARSRINTLFMVTCFIGGALGSSLSAMLWHAGGQYALMGLGLGVALVALFLQWRNKA